MAGTRSPQPRHTRSGAGREESRAAKAGKVSTRPEVETGIITPPSTDRQVRRPKVVVVAAVSGHTVLTVLVPVRVTGARTDQRELALYASPGDPPSVCHPCTPGSPVWLTRPLAERSLKRVPASGRSLGVQTAGTTPGPRICSVRHPVHRAGAGETGSVCDRHCGAR